MSYWRKVKAGEENLKQKKTTINTQIHKHTHTLSLEWKDNKNGKKRREDKKTHRNSGNVKCI